MIGPACADRLLARFARELVGDPRAPTIIGGEAIDRRAAHAAWAHRVVDEYRSVVVFGELAVLLAELAAPLAALAAVHRLVGDELRHAHACAAQATAFADGAPVAIDLAELGLPPRAPDEPRGRRAAMIVGRELVVGEEESVRVLAACRDAATEPTCRGVLAGLLRDEVRHAAAGRALLAAFLTGPLAPAITDADRRDLAAVMAGDRAALRAGYRATAIGGPGRAFGASLTGADLDAKERTA